MNIAFFTSSPDYTILKRVFNNYTSDIDVLYIFNSPQSATGDNATCIFNRSANRPYHFLLDRNIDVAIVYGWPYIIPTDILNVITFYNIHPSLLPKYRGPIPLQFQLLNREKQGGITIHKVTKEIDAGPIAKQKPFPISDSDDIKSLSFKVTRYSSLLLNEFIKDLLNFNISLTPQDESQAFYNSYEDYRLCKF